jgi:hypothetical protein
MAVAAGPIPDPQTVWVPSTMTEVKIQDRVEHSLLWPKAMEDDLRQGLEAQRATAAQVSMPVPIKARTFRPKLCAPNTMR